MDEETREAIAILTARQLVVREVVARLLTYEALRHDNREGFLQHLSQSADHSIDQSAAGLRIGPKTIMAQEAARTESDWLIAAVRKLIAGTEEC